MNGKFHQQGVTLNELLLALAVGAVLVGLAVPAFTALTKNNRLITETNTLIGHINLARSEAIKRNQPVALCRSADPTAANPVCGGSANDWTSGWIVFVDDDDNGVFDGDLAKLLRRWAPSTSVTIRTNSTVNNNLQIDRRGGTNEGGNSGVFAICDDRGVGSGRQINVGPVGRPELQKPPSDCAAPTP
ncbi:MAG: GspH/FimT family pseudopilin [Pseudomonadota bacterium]|nr:GspH/FimT family pseudopilin [Pseudomonadota bacterium]